jgi:hypothetical protein
MAIRINHTDLRKISRDFFEKKIFAKFSCIDVTCEERACSKRNHKCIEFVLRQIDRVSLDCRSCKILSSFVI